MSKRGLEAAIRHAAEAFGGAEDEVIAAIVSVGDTPDARAILEDQSMGAIAKLGALAASLTATAYATKENAGMKQVRSSTRITTSQERVALIEQDVMEVRRRIFGATAPPFAHYHPDAIKWLLGNSVIDPFPPVSLLQDPRAGPAIDDCFDDLIPEYFKEWFEFSYEPRRLAYFAPDSASIQTIEVGYRTALDFLRWFCREAEQITRFPQAALLIHILTGAQPMLPRWQLVDRNAPHRMGISAPVSEREHNEGGRTSPSVFHDAPEGWWNERHPYASNEGWDLTINASNYTWKDHQEVFRAITDLRGSHPAFLDHTDRILLSVIQERGGLPPKGARGNGRFWESVKTECKRRGIESFGGPDAPRKRAERLKNAGFDLSVPASSTSSDRELHFWWCQHLGRESPPITGDWRKG